jgi:Zn ribbon nucleic-acid-binding protein
VATNPKMKACPKCGLTDFLAVYDYDGWKHVECDNGFNTSASPCLYLGPGEGSIRQAIKSHNASRDCAIGEKPVA